MHEIETELQRERQIHNYSQISVNPLSIIAGTSK